MRLLSGWSKIIILLALIGYGGFRLSLYLKQTGPLLNYQQSGFETDDITKVAKPSKYNLSNFTTSTVKRVVDGDTFVIESGEYVRYVGINTPETVDPQKPVECFGKEASAYNKKLILSKTVNLVKDVSDTDKYQRLLRYVYLPDGTFVNLKLVQQGYASVMTVPPDVKYSKDFVAAQKTARENKLGLWSKCK